MSLSMHWQEALRNLITAKLRSILAVLGILVGSAAIVTLVSSSQMATVNALAQFKRLGTNLLLVQIYPRQHGTRLQSGRRITLSDVARFAHASSQVTQFAAYSEIYFPWRLLGQAHKSSIFGVTREFADVMHLKMAAGRMIVNFDRHQPYAVIGARLAHELREHGKRPLGAHLKVHNHYYTVVGILQPYQRNYFLYDDIDSGILLPLQTYYTIEADLDIQSVLLRLQHHADINVVKRKLVASAKKIFPTKDVYFRDAQQVVNVIAKQRRTFTYLLAAIGAIALVVGGIGVMNIMLVAVVERRREIGVRLALGAQPRDILWMFLVETMLLTGVGGMLGVGVGVAISYVIAALSQWHFQIYLLSPVLALCIATGVGVISGLYPALRAARLDPIRSMQAE